MKETLRLYSGIALLGLLIVGGVWIALRHVASDSGVAASDERRVELTPTVVDSIRAIGQWELASVSVTATVDTVRRRWLGLVTETLSRRYAGTLSVGINLARLPEDGSWHSVQGDSIVLTVPDVCLLDTNFIDESRTQTTAPHNSSFAEDSATATAMLARARRRMAAEGLTCALRGDCQQRATQQLTQAFRAIGYRRVLVRYR